MALKELVLCHVIKNGTVLLIKSNEGINKGKWNAATGEMAQGERPDKSAIKNLYQQTGLYATKTVENGTIRLFLNGKNEADYRLHIYSTKVFSGDIKPNMENEVKWFGPSDIPYYEMWPDDKYWIDLVLQGKKFDADFFFDEKNERIVKYQIKERQEIAKKIMPAIIVLAIIALIAIGISYSGILSGKYSHPSSPTAFTPSKSTTTATVASTTTTATTSYSTTILPTPTIIQIDNINMEYNYSGPSQVGTVYCNQPSKTVVVPYRREVNSSTFLLNTTIGTTACGLTVTGISSATPGFTITAVEPQPPQYLPPYSQLYFELKITTQQKNYVGPLTIEMSDQ